MPRYQITISAEDYKTMVLELTEEEYRGIRKLVKAMNDPDGGDISGARLPTISIKDLDAERLQEENRRKKKMLEERRAKMMQAKDPKMSLAFRNAMLQKNRKKFS